MDKKRIVLTTLATGAIGGVGILLYRQYEKDRPHRLLEQLKQRLASRGHCDNAWINYTPHHTTHFGETHFGYDGGLTLIENNQPVYYEFFIDKRTGETIQLERKTAPTT